MKYAKRRLDDFIHFNHGEAHRELERWLLEHAVDNTPGVAGRHLAL